MSREIHEDMLWPKVEYKGFRYIVNTICIDNPTCNGHFREIHATLHATEDMLVPEGQRRMYNWEDDFYWDNRNKVQKFSI